MAETVYRLLPQLFANMNVNVTNQSTSGSQLSAGMKTFYRTSLLENAREKHYFNQFGRHQPLPAGNGNTVEWRKWNTFAPSLQPLTEGVIPDGVAFGQTNLTVSCSQYGRYVTISDRLELEYVDDAILGATEELGACAGQTQDILTRNALIGGTNVLYCPKVANGVETAVSSRATLDATCLLTPTVVNRAYTHLKKLGVPTIGGKYLAIIHPSVAYDLRQSQDWIEAHKYAATTEIFNGEIGELHNVRFVETGNVKVISNGADSNPIKVYLCLFLGKDAYGIVDPEGAGMEMIVHDKESGGTSNPLNQFSTVGFKFKHAAKILYQERILRVECASYYSTTDAEN